MGHEPRTKDDLISRSAHETVKEMISRVGYMTSLFFGAIRTKIMCWEREKPERYIFGGCNTCKALLSLTVQEKEQEGAHMTGGLSIEMIYVGKNYFGNHTFKSHETGFPFIQWVPKCVVCAALLSFKYGKKCRQHYREVQDKKRLKHWLDELALKIELPVQPLGIPNLINKCYMNSLLQILCWTPLITSQLAKQLQRQGEREGKMSMSILRLLDHHYSNIGKRTVDKGIAENIIKAARHANPQFEGNNQEDSFEMFNTILSTIEEEARQNFEIMDEETGQGDEESFRNLPVSRLFGGEVITIWSYDSCKCEDRNTQRFTSIPLTVNEETEENDFNVCEHGQSVKDEFEIYQTENVNGEPADLGEDTRDPHEGNPDERKNEENEVVPQEPEKNQVEAIEETENMKDKPAELGQGAQDQHGVLPDDRKNEERKVVPQEVETDIGEIKETGNVNGEPADLGQDTRDPHEGNPDKRKNEENEVVPKEPETNQVQAIEETENMKDKPAELGLDAQDQHGNEEKNVAPQESETYQGGTTENEVVPGGPGTDQGETSENERRKTVPREVETDPGETKQQAENVNGEPSDTGQDTRDPHGGNPDKSKNEENEVVPQEHETNQVEAIEETENMKDKPAELGQDAQDQHGVLPDDRKNEEKNVAPQESETNQGGTTENEVVQGGSRTDQRESTENDKGHSVNKYTDVEKGLHQMLSSVEEFDEELLGCRRCEPDRHRNGKARGIKRVSIAPPVLVLQLNRAIINEAAGKLEKIERKLTYPEVFDLAPFCETDPKEPQEPVLYSLYGIVNHIGSISSGHYFAYIKAKNRNVNFILKHLEGSSRDKLDQVDKDSEWYYVSDTTVKQCKQDNALNSGGAYILMYERTDKRQE